MQLLKPMRVDDFCAMVRHLAFKNHIKIEDHYVKKFQMLYGVLPLNTDGSFEGMLTYAEGRGVSASEGRGATDVDGGLVITDRKYYVPEKFSWIETEHPRGLMALVLGNLFPNWMKYKPDYKKGWNVSIGEGTAIGQPGFGVAWIPDRWVRFPQLGGVRIGDETTIGAGCTIDRGALTDTVIGNDCHLDDGVHIGHGTQLADHVIVCANAMLSGSVMVEEKVWIGPNASIMQGVTIGAGATIGIGATVLRDVKAGETIVASHRVIETKDKQLGVTR